MSSGGKENPISKNSTAEMEGRKNQEKEKRTGGNTLQQYKFKVLKR